MGSEQDDRRPVRILGRYLLVGWVLGTFSAREARADRVVLKDGQVILGLIDQDGTQLDIIDHEGLRRVVLRESRVAKITSEEAPRAERFRLVQPLTVHAGQMPTTVYNVEATPWDALGRRTFRYASGRSGGGVKMTQAINDLGPFAVRYRGIDGFWVGGEATSLVPREVVLGLLAKVDPKNQEERLRVGRFLIQAEWFAEARAELDRLEADFPELKETVATVRGMVAEAEARRGLEEIDLRTQAGQPRAVEALLRKIPADTIPADLAVDVRNRLRVIDARRAEDRGLAASLQQAADALDADARARLEQIILEMLRDLTDAPDAVRVRLAPFVEAGAATPATERFALALSAWIGGAPSATRDLRDAEVLWKARDLLGRILATTDAQTGLRRSLLDELTRLRRPAPGGDGPLELPMLTAIVGEMRPALDELREVPPGIVRMIRVHDDPNPAQPSEYAVWLPPEYHPLRRYAALVVLGDGRETSEEALAPWVREAERRGSILIAPQYGAVGEPGSRTAYRYTESEHAAVLLALRDALKRFSIDADRVFLAGMLEGGNMAWDFGLAHPDLFAGVAAISGLPAKYVWPYRNHSGLVPLLLVSGELAPADTEVAFEQWIRPQVQRGHDVMAIRYFRRGLERFPEAIPDVFAWMKTRRRAPAPKQFAVATARESDDRFYGLVARSWAPRRTVRPEGADPLGRNIHAAELKARSNAVLNKMTVDVDGVTAFDVWIGPASLDLSKRIEVQVGSRSVFKGMAKLDDPTAYLEDLRIRGDREQVYWMKIPVNLAAPRVGR